MNINLKNYAKEEIKSGLRQCTEGQQMKFKRMYSPKNLDLSIDEVINKIPDDKLDWAMQQVMNTLKDATYY